MYLSDDLIVNMRMMTEHMRNTKKQWKEERERRYDKLTPIGSKRVPCEANGEDAHMRSLEASCQ
jgi:hypothetical protein